MIHRQILYNMIYDMQCQAHTARVSDDRSAIAMHAPGQPVWVWLRDDWHAEHLRSFFLAYICDCREPIPGVVAERGTAIRCAESYTQYTGITYKTRDIVAYFITAEQLSRRLRSKPVSGFTRTAAKKDAPLLARWIADFYREALKTSPPFEESTVFENMSNVRRATDGQLFVWQDDGLAAMGMLSVRSKTMRRLNLIFTPEHLRGRGYGKSIVIALAERTIREGRLPVLYTAEDNSVANRMYRSLGFEEAGRLTEVRFNNR